MQGNERGKGGHVTGEGGRLEFRKNSVEQVVVLLGLDKDVYQKCQLLQPE